jgi:hypothetical protein
VSDPITVCLLSTVECFSFSAWTLNSYIRKFESLQEELIKALAQEQARYEDYILKAQA